jgi:hypothetical protein
MGTPHSSTSSSFGTKTQRRELKVRALGLSGFEDE